VEKVKTSEDFPEDCAYGTRSSYLISSSVVTMIKSIHQHFRQHPDSNLFLNTHNDIGQKIKQKLVLLNNL
jgi:hypothetical protein